MGVVLNTLFSASGYRIAMTICKGCVLESYETVKKFENYIKTSRKLKDFEIGPSGDFVLHGNCILMSCSDRVRSLLASGRSLTPNVEIKSWILPCSYYSSR